MQRDIRGNLALTPVAHILQTVRGHKLTGRGTFSQANRKIELAFRDGQIVHAASNDPDQRLGEILLREGIITLDHYLKSVELLLETGKRQGEILLEEGYLDKHELKRGIRIQMKEIIYDLLAWESGEYLFRWTPPIEESVLLTVSIYELILRGMRRCDRFSKLRETLAPWHRAVALNTEIDREEARNIRLKEDETTVLGLVDGTRSVRSLIDFAPYPDLTTMQILYGLKWARIVTFVDESGEPDDTLP